MGEAHRVVQAAQSAGGAARQLDALSSVGSAEGSLKRALPDLRVGRGEGDAFLLLMEEVHLAGAACAACRRQGGGGAGVSNELVLSGECCSNTRRRPGAPPSLGRRRRPPSLTPPHTHLNPHCAVGCPTAAAI